MLRNESRKRKRSFSFFEPNKKPKLVHSAELQEVLVEAEPLPVFFPLSSQYSQEPLLKRINAYLEMHSRPKIDESGYCHGLAILWLQKMAEGCVDWFYYIRDAIIAYPWSRIDEIELDIEKFVALIELGQNIQRYLKVSMQDISQILENDNIESKLFVGSKESLSHLFRDRRNVVMYVVSCNAHCIAIYQSNGVYHLFDPNYDNGYAKIFDNRHIMSEEILNCLFRAFGIAVPDELKITIARVRDPQALHYTVPLFKEVTEIKEVDDVVEKVEAEVEFKPTSNSFCVIL